MGQGRIRRVGTDTVINYTIEATETYDEDLPGDSPSSWGTDEDIAATGLPFSTPLDLVTESVHLGCLITFQRRPEYFWGAKVKLRPFYGVGEQPLLEMWTRDTDSGEWTLRRRIDLSNAFVGVPSGLTKMFDLSLALERTGVDMVWITHNPTNSATLSPRFLAIHLFGRCDTPIEFTDLCDEEGDDPEVDDCLPPFDWPKLPDFPDLCVPEEVAEYRQKLIDLDDEFPELGFDVSLDEFDAYYAAIDLNALCVTFEYPEFPDICDESAVAAYRATLIALGVTVPAALVLLAYFDSFYNSLDLEVFCDEPPDPPVPPDLPPIDLCDPEAVAAYKLLLTAEQLAYFEELIEISDLPTLCADGFPPDDPTEIDPKPEPIEEYIDPITLEPDCDPQDPDCVPIIPIDGGGGGGPEQQTLELPLFVFYNSEDQAWFETNIESFSAEIQIGWVSDGKQVINMGGEGRAGVGKNFVDVTRLELPVTDVVAGLKLGIRAIAGFPPGGYFISTPQTTTLTSISGLGPAIINGRWALDTVNTTFGTPASAPGTHWVFDQVGAVGGTKKVSLWPYDVYWDASRRFILQGTCSFPITPRYYYQTFPYFWYFNLLLQRGVGGISNFGTAVVVPQSVSDYVAMAIAANPACGVTYICSVSPSLLDKCPV